MKRASHLGWRKRLLGGQKGNGGEGMRGAGNEGNLGLTIIKIIIIRMTMKKLRFTCQQLLAYFPLLIVAVG